MNKTVKKTLKISGITLGSLLLLVLLTVGIAVKLVLTPEKLTSIANKAIEKYSPARAELGRADLTVIGSFPFLGFRMSGLTVFDDMEDSPSDTLASIQTLTVTVDLMKLYEDRQIILTNFYTNGVRANLYTAADGRSNLDVFMGGTDAPKDTVVAEPDTVSSEPLEIYVDLQRISLRDIAATYQDVPGGINASVSGLNVDISGLLNNMDSINAQLKVGLAKTIAIIKNDSTNINAGLDGLSIEGDCSKYGNDVALNLVAKLAGTKVAMPDMKVSFSDLMASIDSTSCQLVGDTAVANVNSRISFSVNDISALMDSMSVMVGRVAMTLPHASLIEDSARVDRYNLDISNIKFKKGEGRGAMTVDLGGFGFGLDAGARTDLSHALAEANIGIRDLVLNLATWNPLDAHIRKLDIKLDALVDNDQVTVTPHISSPALKLLMGGKNYLNGWPMSFDMPLQANMSTGDVTVGNGSSIALNGEEIDFTATGNMFHTDNMSGRITARTQGMDIDKVIGMLPEEYRSMLDGIDLKGLVDLDLNADYVMKDGTPDVNQAKVILGLAGFNAGMNHDSLTLTSSRLKANVAYPSLKVPTPGKATADLDLSLADLNVNMTDSTSISALLKDIVLGASVIGLTDTLTEMSAALDLTVGSLRGSMDTISAHVMDLALNGQMYPTEQGTSILANIDWQKLSAQMGSMLGANVGKTQVKAMSNYDESKTDMLLQWDPRLKVLTENVEVEMLADPVTIPTLDFDFSLGQFNINECRVETGGSDVEFWGNVYNIDDFLDKTGLLTGELFLESDHMDVNRLMNLTSNREESTETTTDSISEPIIIPRGIDLTLYTNLANLEYNGHSFNNVGGDVTIKDGTAVLQELGFSSDAAQMQLTAIYKAPEIENRFVELNFHLLDIEMDQLIDLIPAVDSIAPMLKAFKGKAAFHLAAETNLKKDYLTYGSYYPVMSTLMANAAIEGKDLVVLDNDVFNSIKKKLLMSKDARNVIDSLDVELQVLGDEVDLFPTRIRMDKYEAILGGRHYINDDMNCDYHISLTDSPLPMRLGLTVSGPLQGISDSPLKHISVGKAKYGKLYSPKKQGNVEASVLKMKQDILDTMRSNVR